MSYTMNDVTHKVDDLERWRKRLIYRSGHRGMKEMDLLMGKFAQTHVATFDTDQLKEYEAVLDINDPDLLNLYLGKTEANESQKSDILTMFLASHL